jgi:glycopeptide antibiotics resistance protein
MIEGWIVYLLAVPLAVFVARRARRRGRSPFQATILALLVVYLGWMASATFFPLPVRPDVVRLERAEGGVTVDLVPARSTLNYIRWVSPEKAVIDVGGNVLVFVPFGMLLALVAPRVATWRRILGCGLLLSLSIELGQLAVSLVLGYSYRVTDIDDVILNVVGVLLGFAAWLLVRARLVEAAPPAPDRAGGQAGVLERVADPPLAADRV